MASSESNNGLYFIVGALVVATAIVGFFFFSSNNTGANYGPAPTTSITMEKDNDVDQTSVKIDENGSSITHSETER